MNKNESGFTHSLLAGNKSGYKIRLGASKDSTLNLKNHASGYVEHNSITKKSLSKTIADGDGFFSAKNKTVSKRDSIVGGFKKQMLATKGSNLSKMAMV